MVIRAAAAEVRREAEGSRPVERATVSGWIGTGSSTASEKLDADEHERLWIEESFLDGNLLDKRVRRWDRLSALAEALDVELDGFSNELESFGFSFCYGS